MAGEKMDNFLKTKFSNPDERLFVQLNEKEEYVFKPEFRAGTLIGLDYAKI